jgi:hypothetical protein
MVAAPSISADPLPLTLPSRIRFGRGDLPIEFQAPAGFRLTAETVIATLEDSVCALIFLMLPGATDRVYRGNFPKIVIATLA